jgi:hypothetical protein
MDVDDKQKFIANTRWFNQFFDGLRQLLKKIAKSLTTEFPVLTKELYYYTKPTDIPSIPDYCVLGLGGEDYAIQIYVIFNPSWLDNQHIFKPDPSFIIVKHSQGAKFPFFDDFGIRAIKNKGIDTKKYENGILSGKIVKNETYFHAFQIFLDIFTQGQNIENAIRTQIIEKIKMLPDWEMS